MASESVSFNFLSTGADRLAGDFRKTGDAATLAARGARLLKDSLEAERRSEDASARATISLAKAQELLAKEAEYAGAKTAEEVIAIDREKRAAEEAARANDKLARSNQKVADSQQSVIDKIAKSDFLKPSGKGFLWTSLLTAGIPAAAGLAGAVGLVGASFGAAAVSAGLFGKLASTVLTSASQDTTKLAALNQKLNAATTDSAKKAIKQQIAALEAGWTPAYKKLMGNLQDFKQQWKATAIAIAAPGVAAWLGAVKDGLQFLKPLLDPVAAVFTSWGQSIDKYFSSSRGSAEITKLASAFGQFSALQLSLLGNVIKNIGVGVFNLGKDITGVNWGSFAYQLSLWSDSFARWSKSKQARDDVHSLLRYVHDNGHTIVTIFGDLAKFIPGIFSGASAAGQLELQALSGVLGWVSKLPPSWAKPITELAGAMLLLSKTGLLKVGVQLAGKAASLVSGGTLSLSGSSAAAEIEAAFKTGGETAAAEIRAAMTGGTATGGAESAAGGAATGGIAGRLKSLVGAAAAAAGPFAGGILAGGLIKGLGDHLARGGTDAGRLNKTLQSAFAGIPGYNIFSGFIAKSLPALAGFISNANKKWADFLAFLGSRAIQGGHDVEAAFDSLRHGISSKFDAIRHDVASAWNTIWGDTMSGVRRGVGDVVSWFAKLPGEVEHSVQGLGTWMYNFGKNALTMIWHGAQSVVGSVTGFFSSFAHGIVSVFKKIWGWFSPSAVMYEGGKSLMEGLFLGIKDHAHKAQNLAAKTAGGITGAFSGSARQEQRYAASLFGHFGWGGSQLGPLIALWNRESGWNPLAMNPSSGAFGIAQALGHGLPGTGGRYGNQYPSKAANEGNAGAQIAWGLSYIAGQYGSPANAWAHELAAGWYGSGLDAIFTKPTLIGVGERGPEHVQVTPRGRGGGGNVYITVNVPPTVNPREVGRQVSDVLKAHIKAGGTLYPAGVTPR